MCLLSGSFTTNSKHIFWVVPPPSNSGNEGLGWDSLLKMVHNPGGDWNPGRGDNPTHIYQNHADCEGDILFEVVRRLIYP